MKKLSIFLFAALALGMTSCYDDAETKGIPQKNEAEPVLAVGDIALQNADLTEGVVVADLANEGITEVRVGDVTQIKNLPQGYDLSVVMNVGPNAEFTKLATVPLTMKVTELYAQVADLEEAFKAVVGMTNVPTTLFTEFVVSTVFVTPDGSQQVALVGNYAPSQFEFTPNFALSLYTPGNSNNWNQGNSQQLQSNDGVTYWGYAYLDGEFKFSNQPNWDGINYGPGDDEGQLSTDGGAGNLSAPAAGLYYLTVNTSELTYTMTLINSLGCIGDFNSWGSQLALTPSADFLTWTGTLSLSSESVWKFRMNDNWDVNLGGALDNLVPDGDNITTPGGNYTVTIDFHNIPITATLEEAGELQD